MYNRPMDPKSDQTKNSLVGGFNPIYNKYVSNQRAENLEFASIWMRSSPARKKHGALSIFYVGL